MSTDPAVAMRREACREHYRNQDRKPLPEGRIMPEIESRTDRAATLAQKATLSEGRSFASNRSTVDPLDGNGPIPALPSQHETATNAIRHNCGRWRTGARVAHCGGCHEHFSSTTAFDQHQRGGRPGSMCRKPDEVGLVAVEKPYGVLWSWPDNGRNPHAGGHEEPEQ